MFAKFLRFIALMVVVSVFGPAVGALAAQQNIAENATLSFSREWIHAGDPIYSGPASFAIDNDPNTSWTSGGHSTATDRDWLKFDLGNVYSIDNVELTGSNSTYWGTPYENYWHDYNLYRSVDDSAWTFVAAGQLVDSPNDALRIDLLSLSGANARFLKYEVLETSKHWAGLNEIRVYGNGPVTVTPEPVSAALFVLGAGALAARGLRKKKKGR